MRASIFFKHPLRQGSTIGVIATGATLMTVCAGATVASAAESERLIKPQNIVYVLVDDMDNSTFREALRMGVLPNIQRELIDKGTDFKEAFVAESLCCPSRVTSLTGQYTHNHGVNANGGAYGGFEAFDTDQETTAVWLKAKGYRTGLFGKYLNGYKGTSGYVPPGWTDWHALNFPGDRQCMYDFQLTENGSGLTTYGKSDDDYQTDVLARRSVEFIRSTPDQKPIFLMVTPTAPHLEGCNGAMHNGVRTIRTAPRYVGKTPVVTPPAFALASFNEADMSDKPRWMQTLSPKNVGQMKDAFNDKLAALRPIDDMVGDLANELRATGRYENTLFVFQSDNGFQYGTHRVDGKYFVYEESIRVTLLVHGPGQNVPQIDSSNWILNTDIAPTIVDFADTKAGRVMDGRSLKPLIKGNGADTWRQSFAIEAPWDGLSKKDYLPYYAVRSKDPVVTGDTSGGTTMVYAVTYGTVPPGPKPTDQELYDLKKDPAQIASVHRNKKYDKQIRAMRGLLQNLNDCVGSECTAIENNANAQFKKVMLTSQQLRFTAIRPFHSVLGTQPTGTCPPKDPTCYDLRH